MSETSIVTRAWGVVQSNASLVTIVVGYGVASFAFSRFDGPGGLITPEGSVDVVYGVVGVSVLVLRVVMIVVVPGMVTYRVVGAAAGVVLRRTRRSAMR
jgi:hypothetical protein